MPLDNVFKNILHYLDQFNKKKILEILILNINYEFYNKNEILCLLNFIQARKYLVRPLIYIYTFYLGDFLSPLVKLTTH